jgi:acetyl esterase/lipase
MNFRKSIFIASALIIFTGQLFAQSKKEFSPQISRGGSFPKSSGRDIKNKFLDIAYANKSNSEKLDIYLPDDRLGPFPVIVFIHGGAFMMGDKGGFEVNSALNGIKHGYAVVSVNYRLSSEALFPAQVQDVKAAIRFLRANCTKYHLNPNKIASWGASAGGYLSSMIGTTGDIAIFDDSELGNSGQSSLVQASVDWFGPIKFDEMDEQFRKSGIGRADHGDANSPESRLMGNQLKNITEMVKRAAPSYYITKKAAPFFIEHGTKDPMVPTQQSINFYDDLQRILGKEKVTLTLLEGASHGGPQFDTNENIAKVFDFLDKYLK